MSTTTENNNTENTSTESTVEEINFKVFVGNLPFSTESSDLETLFADFGTVVSANIIYRGTRSKGYGFVEYATEEEANKAIEAMQGKEIDEREINVEMAKPRDTSNDNEQGAKKKKKKKKKKSKNGESQDQQGEGPLTNRDGHLHTQNACFIANIPFSMEDEQLKELFSEFGVQTARVARRRLGKSKGYGFVELDTAENQQAAIDAMNGKEVEERVISVTAAKPIKASAAAQEVSEDTPSNSV
eukprot:TRINITY_DN1338_c5_g1_i1.p1 TRINITY_DN1338_c5_g1~~TRINITY_DN1338_c5_g1_i1.p1  ORF type:complete len:276 (+),score=105.05 TRINITY_DN1338_c5_g1_i1:100-828(+)